MKRPPPPENDPTHPEYAMPIDAKPVPPPNSSLVARNIATWAMLSLEGLRHDDWPVWVVGLFTGRFHLAAARADDDKGLRVWLCREDCRPIVFIGVCPKWVPAMNRAKPGLS